VSNSQVLPGCLEGRLRHGYSYHCRRRPLSVALCEGPMRRLLCSSAVLLTLAVAAVRRQSTAGQQNTAKSAQATDMHAASFAGCYEVKLGRWWPWGFGDENRYVTPPSRLQLLMERGTRGFEQGELLIRAIPGHEPSAGSRESSFWEAKSPAQLELAWTDGFVGVTLDLKRNRDELTGWAHPHFDDGNFVPRTAHVTAHRIACGGSASQ
jgi:hypothetical protein